MSLPRHIPTSGRVALAVTTVLVVGVTAMSLIAYLGVSGRMADDVDRSLQREAESYAAAVSPGAHPEGLDLLAVSRAYLQGRTGAQTDSGAILLLRLTGGRVITNSDLPLEDASANTALLKDGWRTTKFADITYGGDAYRVAVLPVRDTSGTLLATFEAALPLGPSRQIATQLAWTLFGSGMAVALLGAALSAFVAQGSLRPLRRAARTAREVTMSSLGRRIPYEGADDDVGRMVGALNGMLERLEAAFAEQRHFVADASHELRTPLAVVRGHLELLAAESLSAEEREETLAIAFAEIDRMSRLVDDLLSLARLDAARPVMQPVELRTLVAEAAARFRAVCGCGILRAEGEPVWVSGDPDGLMQAVLNLVRNAEAHTPADGAITLTSRRERGAAVIEVADTGSGIRDADLAHVFDRFYRSQGSRRSDTGGSGLGLAITKRLVELHGGEISAANRDGGGAVFRIELPAIAAPREVA